jgi:polyribonucleotide nucleotidyltransferase
VKVVEVDRERGRIGLRLAEDPSIAGKSNEELASVVASGGDRGSAGGGRPPRDRGERNGGGRDSRGSGRPRHRRGDSDPDRG